MSDELREQLETERKRAHDLANRILPLQFLVEKLKRYQVGHRNDCSFLYRKEMMCNCDHIKMNKKLKGF